jgi:hypothetical protein
MKRILTYVRKSGTVSFQTPRGETIEIPIFSGILKNPSVSQLPILLNNPAAIRKYTCEPDSDPPQSPMELSLECSCLESQRLQFGKTALPKLKPPPLGAPLLNLLLCRRLSIAV